MKDASSEWSSELTARLIDKLLIDDKGNRVTLFEAWDSKKIELKAKGINAGTMINALTGKFGESIEKIYREYDNKHDLNTLDFKLGDAIIITGNESLKKLAIELNNKSKHKGEYVYAEAVVRILNGDDDPKWFDKQIGKIPPKERPGTPAFDSYPVIRAIDKIRFMNGEYSLCMRKFDEVMNKWVYTDPRPIKKSVVYMITDLLIKYSAWKYDHLMANWADPNDREYCQKLADVFIDHGITQKFGSPVTLSYLRNLGIVNVKGLALKYCQNNPHPKDGRWSLQGFFNVLQGDNEYKLAEAREIVELLKSGKLKMKISADEIQQFSDWAEERFK